MIIDTHTHITSEELLPERQNILEQMKVGNPAYLFEAGSRISDIEDILEIVNEDNIFAYVGVHPHYVEEDDNYQRIIDVAKSNKKIVGIGEIGLDYHYDFKPRELQQKKFKEQIEIASSLDLPIILHIREAYQDSLKILNDMKRYLQKGLYMHCYSGSKELVGDYKKLGAVFGFAGVITFKKANKENIIREAGLDYIFSETDAPYLTPEPFRGRVNKPEYVKYIVEKYVEIFEKDQPYIESKIKDNVNRFFGGVIK